MDGKSEPREDTVPHQRVPRNNPVVWGTAIPQRDEPGAFNVLARICGSSRE